jgi:hypothetical protein
MFWYVQINLLCSYSISCLLGRWVCCLIQLSLLRYIDVLLLLGQQCLLLSGHVGQKVNLLAELETSVESTDDGISIINCNWTNIYASKISPIVDPKNWKSARGHIPARALILAVHSLYCSSVISICSCAALDLMAFHPVKRDAKCTYLDMPKSAGLIIS